MCRTTAALRRPLLLILVVLMCWGMAEYACCSMTTRLGFIPLIALPDSTTDSTRAWQPGRYAVYLHPFPLLGQYLKVSFERRMGKEWSLRALGGFGASKQSEIYNVDNMTSGYLEGQIRAYPAEKVFHGFYWGAYAYAKVMDFSYQIEESNFTRNSSGRIVSTTTTIIGPYRGTVSALGFGYLMGIQRRMGNRLLFDTYIGPGIQMAQFRGQAKEIMGGWHEIFEKSVLDHYASGLWIQLGFAVGWMIY
jgi:hypothetical protein